MAEPEAHRDPLAMRKRFLCAIRRHDHSFCAVVLAAFVPRSRQRRLEEAALP